MNTNTLANTLLDITLEALDLEVEAQAAGFLDADNFFVQPDDEFLADLSFSYFELSKTPVVASALTAGLSSTSRPRLDGASLPVIHLIGLYDNAELRSFSQGYLDDDGFFTQSDDGFAAEMRDALTDAAADEIQGQIDGFLDSDGFFFQSDHEFSLERQLGQRDPSVTWLLRGALSALSAPPVLHVFTERPELTGLALSARRTH